MKHGRKSHEKKSDEGYYEKKGEMHRLDKHERMKEKERKDKERISKRHYKEKEAMKKEHGREKHELREDHKRKRSAYKRKM